MPSLPAYAGIRGRDLITSKTEELKFGNVVYCKCKPGIYSGYISEKSRITGTTAKNEDWRQSSSRKF